MRLRVRIAIENGYVFHGFIVLFFLVMMFSLVVDFPRATTAGRTVGLLSIPLGMLAGLLFAILQLWKYGKVKNFVPLTVFALIFSLGYLASFAI